MGRKKLPPCLVLEEDSNCAGKDDNRALLSQVILLSVSPPPRRNPTAHGFDPFDVLPIPATFKLDILLAFCEWPHF
jgi:hypothetical protein